MIAKCLLAKFVHLPEDRDLLKPKEKSVLFTVFRFSAMLSEAIGRRKISDRRHHAQTRLAWPLSDKTRMRTAHNIEDDLSFFEQHLHPFAYVLLLQN